MKAMTYSLKRRESLELFLFFTLLTFLLALTPSYAVASGDPSGRSLSQAETKYVCMINDQLFKKEQIPVVVDGRTYYGCCRMCKETLRKDPQSRRSLDPVSGKSVDKATAVIGVTPEGDAFYFENVANMKAYMPPVKN